MALTAQFVNGPLEAEQLNASSVPVADATTDITSPFDDQIIVNSTDHMIYRYDESVWVGAVALGGGTAATMHEARYEQRSSAQVITTITDTKLKCELGDTVCDDVTASGTGNTDFLLNRLGVWRLTACARYLGNAGGGERHIFIQTGSTFAVANRLVGHTAVNVGTAPCTVTCSTEKRLNANTTIIVGCFHNAGTSITLDVGFGGTIHFAATWLRP